VVQKQGIFLLPLAVQLLEGDHDLDDLHPVLLIKRFRAHGCYAIWWKFSRSPGQYEPQG